MTNNHCDYILMVSYKTKLPTKDFYRSIIKLQDNLTPPIGIFINTTIFAKEESHLSIYVDQKYYPLQQAELGTAWTLKDQGPDIAIEKSEYTKNQSLFDHTQTDYAVSFTSQSVNRLDTSTDYRCY